MKSYLPDLSGGFKTIKKILLTVLLLSFVIFSLTLGLYFTKTDATLANITLEGYIVSDLEQDVLPGATVSIDGYSQNVSNIEGFYKLENLDLGTYTLTVTKDGYATYTENIEVTRSLFNYKNEKSILLNSESLANVSGTIIAPDGYQLDVNKDELMINGKKITYSLDGTFNLGQIEVGEYPLIFTSPNFNEINKTITINAGINNIGSLELAPSGRLEGSIISYVKGDLVEDLKIRINNVQEERVIIDKDMEIFVVEDLEIGKKYLVRVSADGYEEREYELDIKQGVNKPFNFRLVEEGTVYFGYDAGEIDEGHQLYKSSYDGENLVNLTKGFLNINPINLYLDETRDKIYFQSGFQELEDSKKEVISPIYALDLNNNSFQYLQEDISLSGRIIPNYKAELFSTVYYPDRKSNFVTLGLKYLNGSTFKDITSASEGEFLDSRISDDSTWLYYTYRPNKDSEMTLTRMNIQTLDRRDVLENPAISILDVSPDGTRVLLTAIDENTRFVELVVYDLRTSELRTLATRNEGNNYRFLNGSNNKFLYINNEDGRSNIFLFNIDKNSEEQITSLNTSDIITNFFIQGDYLFYLIRNKGMFILDLDKPQNYKLVLNGDFNI
ncbi:MAG: carboxypeptidase regulatory-like domain-containing protein [Candidatus Dojkabacteria bacterium]|nr:carboxypeptidase regulatory-like domain-containing protein [Candidatus Dojkabacteria bacterium]